MRWGILTLVFLKYFYKPVLQPIAQIKDFIEKIGSLREKVAKAIQDYNSGSISQEKLESELSESITALNALFPEGTRESLERLNPNWESIVLDIPEEYLPTENNATSANSELSTEELAEVFIDPSADGDFHFAVAMDYIAGSMTDSKLDSFLTEIRNSDATPEEIKEQISIDEISDILEQIETYNLNPTNTIEWIGNRIENGSAVSELPGIPTAVDDSQNVNGEGTDAAPELGSVLKGDPAPEDKTDPSETEEPDLLNPSPGGSHNGSHPVGNFSGEQNHGDTGSDTTDAGTPENFSKDNTERDSSKSFETKRGTLTHKEPSDSKNGQSDNPTPEPGKSPGDGEIDIGGETEPSIAGS